MCETYSSLLGLEVTEHSFRREGAQFYTRHGVTEAIVMYIGRWGSSAVKRYIEDAIASLASLAARDAAASLARGSTSSNFVGDMVTPRFDFGDGAVNIAALLKSIADSGEVKEMVAKIAKDATDAAISEVREEVAAFTSGDDRGRS